MKKILSIATLCLINCHFSFSQKIWYKNEGYIPKDDDTTIRSIRYKTFSKDIILDMKNGDKVVLKGDTLWGFQQREWRLYKPIRLIGFSHYELIDHIEGMYIYYEHHCHYFSVTPTSEVFPLDRKNLLKIYSNDSCFVQKINAWYTIRKKTDNYYDDNIIGKYSSCKH